MEDVLYSNNIPADLILEACVQSVEDAKKAEKMGAHRIELCSHLEAGGLTPPEQDIETAIHELKIPLMVMVRPRAGDFVFSENEMEQMFRTIEYCKRLGVFGVVMGNLAGNHEINLKQTRRLATFAAPLEVTFHKAIDETPDLLASVELLRQIKGVRRILTSGGSDTALNGAKVIRKMIKAARGELTILTAGRVTKENLMEVHQKVGGTEYHGRRIVF